MEVKTTLCNAEYNL